MQFVDLGALWSELGGELEPALRRVCSSGAFIGGEEVAAFEREWAAYTGARHTIGVANGTDALELILRAAELPAGSGVIVPANTFFATAEAVVAAGHRPVFVDVEQASGLVGPEQLGGALQEGAGAVIVVHLYGRMADMEAINRIAAEHGALVIEDAAQAHGARRGGRHAGTHSLAGGFSFYPGKNLGAFGDAGAVITDDDELADRIRLLADHGRSGHDNHVVVGRNSRLDALQAAVLRVKLPHLDRHTAARRQVAERYRSGLPHHLLDLPTTDDPGSESHHLFPILVDGRDQLATVLKAEGIPTGVHYRFPCPATPAFGARAGGFPVAEGRAARQLSLPIHPHLSAEDQQRVIDAVIRHAK